MSNSNSWINPLSTFSNYEVGGGGSVRELVRVEGSNDRFVIIGKKADSVSYRAEVEGLRTPTGTKIIFYPGDTVCLKWDMIVNNKDVDNLEGDAVVFQWKSYPNGLQNYPFLITIKDKKMNLIHVDRNGKWNTLTTQVLENNKKVTIELRMKLSQFERVGWVEFKVNNNVINMYNVDGSGQLKTRVNCRTFDVGNSPKWGFYNRDHPKHEFTTILSNMSMTRQTA